MLILIRIILLALTVVTGLMWYQSHDFLWWGAGFMVSFIALFASVGLDGTDIVFFNWD